MTWALANDYLSAKRTSWAKATYDNRWYHLRRFALACPHVPTTPEPIERFLGAIEDKRYRYNCWSSIRLLYEWASNRRGIQDPCPKVEAPSKPKHEPYYLEEAELTQLLAYPHTPRDRTLLYLLADTGMRRGEAHSMTVENMWQDQRQDQEDQRGGWLYVTGKTGPRWVPVSPKVWDMLMEIRPDAGPFWRGKRGPLSLNGLGTLVWTAFHRAGLIGRKMSSHRLRHTWATLWTGTDSDGMDILGHQDYKTWRIYRTMRPQRLAQAHHEHSPVAQLG